VHGLEDISLPRVSAFVGKNHFPMWRGQHLLSHRVCSVWLQLAALCSTTLPIILIEPFSSFPAAANFSVPCVLHISFIGAELGNMFLADLSLLINNCVLRLLEALNWYIWRHCLICLSEQPWFEQNLITENGFLRLESTRKVLQVLGRHLQGAWRAKCWSCSQLD